MLAYNRGLKTNLKRILNLTLEQKKSFAKIIQDIYLYPYYSKEESIIRCGVWIASWIVGIVFHQVSDLRGLGGAYFIFSLSLLLEFVPVSKMNKLARSFHGLFCVLLVTMFLGSLMLIFGDVSTWGEPQNWFLLFLVKATNFAGWAVFLMMIIDIVLVLFETHKYFYDEEEASKQKIENRRNAKRKQFMDNLNGPMKGENNN